MNPSIPAHVLVRAEAYIFLHKYLGVHTRHAEQIDRLCGAEERRKKGRKRKGGIAKDKVSILRYLLSDSRYVEDVVFLFLRMVYWLATLYRYLWY